MLWPYRNKKLILAKLFWLWIFRLKNTLVRYGNIFFDFQGVPPQKTVKNGQKQSKLATKMVIGATNSRFLCFFGCEGFWENIRVASMAKYLSPKYLSLPCASSYLLLQSLTYSYLFYPTISYLFLSTSLYPFILMLTVCWWVGGWSIWIITLALVLFLVLRDWDEPILKLDRNGAASKSGSSFGFLIGRIF